MPYADRRESGRKGGGARRISLLEMVASGAGLLLTLAMVAFIAWEALTRPGDAMPAVTVEARELSEKSGVWVLAFEAINHAPGTAANVEIEGTLSRDGREVETARASLDYVPGGSTVRGGLFFRADPRRHVVELRAVGYAAP